MKKWRSILEDLPIEKFHRSFQFSPELESGMIPNHSLLTDITPESHSNSSDTYSVGRAKYLKAYTSEGWEKCKVASSKCTPCTAEVDDWTEVKAPLVKMLKCTEDNSYALFDEEMSLEESVLLDLELVMAQLTDKTRICFRDALYRLAKNSRQHSGAQEQNGDVSVAMACADDQMRSGGKRKMEMGTNTIDRAIANMMFNKTEFDVRGFPVSESSNANGPMGLSNCSRDQQQIHCALHYQTFRGDAEVPILAQGHKKEQNPGSCLTSRNPEENMMHQGYRTSS